MVDEVNVEALTSLSSKQVKWLTRMAKSSYLTKRALTKVQDYVKGFMEDSEEELDESESSFNPSNFLPETWKLSQRARIHCYPLTSQFLQMLPAHHFWRETVSLLAVM